MAGRVLPSVGMIFSLCIFVSGVSFAADCVPDKLVGEWVFDSTEHGKTYDDCAISGRDDELFDCSRPSSIYKHGWNGVCEWTANTKAIIRFGSPKGGRVDGLRTYEEHLFGRWSGNRVNHEKVLSCQAPERVYVEQVVSLVSGVFSSEVTESTDAGLIGEIDTASCRMNGAGDQLILTYEAEGEEDRLTRVYRKK